MRLLPLLGAVALLAGCATTTSAAPAPTIGAGRASGPAPHGCTPPAASVTVTDTDNGGVVCLTAGGELTLHLSGDGWKTPTTAGGILEPDGDTAFKAVSTGKTTITSSRPACPAGTVTCHALQAFQVQIVVS